MSEQTAYFNLSSGVSGDMIIASLIDAGVDFEAFTRLLKKAIPVKGWDIRAEVSRRYHVPVRTFEVNGDICFRAPREMLQHIKRSSVPDAVKDKALASLTTLIEAEATVHGVPAEKAHFHELNSIDTIVDILGAHLALHLLEINRVFSSPVNVGMAAPATVEIFRRYKVPVYSSDSTNELATPTGAAIISAIVESFGPMPPMLIDRSGNGAGTRDTGAGPNIVRVLTGKPAGKTIKNVATDEVVLLETNIDDMDPRLYPHVTELLFSAGARDVWVSQVIMKKGRPGIVLSVIADAKDEEKAVVILFQETTTLGIRRLPVQRYLLRRYSEKGIKTALLPDGKRREKGEYEVVRRRARHMGKVLKNILV